MTETQFLAKAKREINSWGLSNWTVKFDRAKIAFGRCHYQRKMITISLPLFHANKQNNFAEVWDTLLHELAHALSAIHSRHYDHGTEWKKWCVRVGAKPQRCYGEDVAPAPAKYHAVNDKGEVLARYYRRPKWAAYSNKTVAIYKGQKTNLKLVIAQ